MELTRTTADTLEPTSAHFSLTLTSVLWGMCRRSWPFVMELHHAGPGPREAGEDPAGPEGHPQHMRR